MGTRRKRALYTIATCLLAFGAAAEPRVLTGTELNELLPRIVASGVGEDTTQTFSASGQTEYITAGRPSLGRWWVTATQYCSSWPPGSGQACYQVTLDEAADPPRLSWIGQSGTPIENTITYKETSR